MHYDEVGKKKCYTYRGTPFKVDIKDNIIEKKEEFLIVMNTMYFTLMEKYSTYSRKDLEKNICLKEQWRRLIEELIAECNIERIGYHLDLKDEKRIGKAKVLEGVTTAEEAFGSIRNLKVWGNRVMLDEENL